MEIANPNLPHKWLKDVINPWLLGADPEFAVISPPDSVVPNSGQNAVNTHKAAGDIGADHNGRVWELRPAPSPSAYMVAVNLWNLLRQNELDKLEKFKWKSGALGAKKHPTGTHGHWTHAGAVSANMATGYTYAQAVALADQQQAAWQTAENSLDTLGGHVHFGISSLSSSQRKALNNVTTGLLNLEILPCKENSKRLSLTANSSPKYGHFDGGDAVRDCDGHVEYRCAPSWLDKPGQALAALTAYKLAAARPSSVKWPEEHGLKAGFLEWIDDLSPVDVDAWILANFVDRQGFENIQADPSADFKANWNRHGEHPWRR